MYVSTAAAIGRELWLRFVGNFSWRGRRKGHAIVKTVIVVHTVCYGSVHRHYRNPALCECKWFAECAKKNTWQKKKTLSKDTWRRASLPSVSLHSAKKISKHILKQ
jgi:hypothetical protein